MPRKLDLIGKRFGRFVVISESPVRDEFKNYRWLCKCDCGNEAVVLGYNLQRGNTLSCGCHKIAVKTKHGHCANNGRTSEYNAWDSMQSRCYNPKYEHYHLYGGRGIIVCERWLGEGGFENFLFDMGPKPKGTSLDRWPNNDGNYEPGNCRWGTGYQQGGNKRNNHWLEHDGRRMILSDWARFFGIRSGNLCNQLKTKSISELFIKYAKQ